VRQVETGSLDALMIRFMEAGLTLDRPQALVGCCAHVYGIHVHHRLLTKSVGATGALSDEAVALSGCPCGATRYPASTISLGIDPRIDSGIIRAIAATSKRTSAMDENFMMIPLGNSPSEKRALIRKCYRSGKSIMSPLGVRVMGS
jgi:hypothetical protein